MRTLRPRGLFGVIKARGPAPLRLYVAAREHRLVWQGEQSFALVEEPTTARSRLFRGGLRLSLLRLADRHWDALVYVTPPSLLVALAAATLFFRPLWPVTVVAALLALVHVFLLLSVMLLSTLDLTRRQASRREGDDRKATRALPAGYWHLPLCHQGDSGRGDELLRLASARLVSLVSARLVGWAEAHGARVTAHMVSETLVCLVRGATTTAMRDTIRNSSGMIHPYGHAAEVVVMTAPHRAVAKPAGPEDRGGFLVLYLGALAVYVAIIARFVADSERAACAPSSCAGRPDGYLDAVRWLSDQLIFFLGGSNLAPATQSVWALGWLTRVAGLIGVLVAVVAARRFIATTKAPHDRFREETEKLVGPTVLILVVKHNERDAVMAAARDVTNAEPHPRFRGGEVAWELGTIGGSNVLLAQCPGKGGHGPNGMAAFASKLITSCDPDYLILTGICYGLKEDVQEPGDVLVSKYLHNIDPHRVTVDREQPTGDYVPASGFMVSRFDAAQVTWPKPPVVHFGLMLGSDNLYDAPYARAKLKAMYPEAIGGEMEGESVYSIAAANERPWIVVKAISDFAQDKDSSFQELATDNAARFVIHTVRSGGFAHGPDRRRSA